MRHRAITTSVASTAVVALGLTLAACTATDDAVRPAPTPASSTAAEVAAGATSTPTSAPSDPAGPPPAQGTVVLDTDLATPDGRASIHLRVVANGHDDYTVQTSAYRSSLGIPLAIFFRQFDESVGDHVSEGVSFGYTNWAHPGVGTQAPPPEYVLDAGDDPSFLRTAVLASEDDATDPLWPVLAVAPLHWSTPDRHPDLHVVDGGSAPRARGTVDSEGGVPRWYHVADRDVAADVAERFGVTTDDLDYLSARQAVDVDQGLRTGEILNLDRTKR